MKKFLNLISILLLCSFSAKATPLNSISKPNWVSDDEFLGVHYFYNTSDISALMIISMGETKNRRCVFDYTTRFDIKYTERALQLVKDSEIPYVKYLLTKLSNYPQTAEFKSNLQAFESAMVAKQYEQAEKFRWNLITKENIWEGENVKEVEQGASIFIEHLNEAYADMSIQENARRRTLTCSIYDPNGVDK